MADYKVPLTPVERAIGKCKRAVDQISSAYRAVRHGRAGWVFSWAGWLGDRALRAAAWYKRRVWDRWAVNASGKVTALRAAITAIITASVIWCVPAVIATAWNAGLMLTTWKVETVFLTATEEIDPDNDVHSVRGCVSFPCTEKEAVYYRVSRNALHDVYSLTKRGYFFYPEEVASVVAPGVNKCEVTSYGIRLRAMMRGWGVYPHLLNAVCAPFRHDGGAGNGAVTNPADDQKG